jgi:mRNA interferase MazF
LGHTSTRDLLLKLGAARRQSADQVIRAALEAMKPDERRQLAAREARAIRDDPVDLAGIRANQQDMAALLRGEVYRLPAPGKGYEQHGRRYAVVLQPDWLSLSTRIVAFTSTSARETTFRPVVEIADQRTLVMCDQLATVDLNRLTEPAGASHPR